MYKKMGFVLVMSLVAACADPVGAEFVLVSTGLDRGDLLLEVRSLGTPARPLLDARIAAGDVDGAALLPDGACGGPCRSVELTLFVQNRAKSPAAPPVIRLSTPPGRAERAPVAFRAQEISAGRSGRIRWLMSLWPEEQLVEVKPSASVFFEVYDPPPRGGTHPEKERPVVEGVGVSSKVRGMENPGRRHEAGQ